MKNLKVFGLLALILAVGLIFASCGDNSEPDTWSTPTNLAQLDGTWIGTDTEKHTYKEWFAKWESTWSNYYETLCGNMSMERKNEHVIAINSAAKTYSQTIVENQIFSGGKIATAWDVMKTWTWNSGNPEFIDKNHSFRWTKNYGPFSIGDGFLNSFQINQNGKKIKILKYFNDGRDFVMSK
jgi:hypothetical protein